MGSWAEALHGDLVAFPGASLLDTRLGARKARRFLQDKVRYPHG
jgi:hypothetical protein